MKETPKSLSIFLFIVGLFGVWQILNMGAAFSASIFLGVVSLITAVLGAITLYIAVRLKYLLQNNVDFLVKFFWIQIIYPFLAILAEVAIAAITQSFTRDFIVNIIVALIQAFVINFLILIYIIKQVKKLSLAATLPPLPPAVA